MKRSRVMLLWSKSPHPANETLKPQNVMISLQNWGILSRFLHCHSGLQGTSLLSPFWHFPSLSYSRLWKATRLNESKHIQSVKKTLHPFLLSRIKQYTPGFTIPNICPTYFLQKPLNVTHHPKPQTNPSKTHSAWPLWISSCIIYCLLQYYLV